MQKLTLGSKDKSYVQKLRFIRKELYKGRYIYLMLLPVIAYFIIFEYFPMYGIVIAFKDFKPMVGIMRSPWIGFENFINFFNSFYFWRLIRNTFLLSFYDSLFNFPLPIILALLLNEVRSRGFKKIVQTSTYLPHFISLVVIIGIMVDFLSYRGLVNNLVVSFGGERTLFMGEAQWFRPLYVFSGIWKGTGWRSIIYFAALSSIDQQLYDAATIDGAGRYKQAIHVTLAGIAPTIIIILILNLGSIMAVGFQKALLMQNTLNITTSDVIPTFIYRRGLINADFSYSTAVGLFNNIINFTMLIVVNKISRKVTETSLW